MENLSQTLFRWVGLIRAAHITTVLCLTCATSGWHNVTISTDEALDYIEAALEAMA
jgi:hypothetical protein